jgi:hypothetical protein
MLSAGLLPLAAADPFVVGRPLFGHAGLALLAVLGGVAGLLLVVALVGRWLAATHPSPPPRAVVVADVVAPRPVARHTPEVLAGVASEAVPVILAVVAQMFGARARVASIRPTTTPPPAAIPSTEALFQQWSYEGRRQIYSSHKVR